MHLFTRLILLLVSAAPVTPASSQPASPEAILAPVVRAIEVTPSTWPTIRNRLAGEQEYVFANGIYDGIVIPAAASGSTFRSRNPWGAEIVSAVHGIEISPGASDVTVSGFRVSSPRGTGIKSAGYKNIRIEKCWVRHAGQSGISGFHHSLIISGCLVEFCGEDPVHDHGIYVGGKPMGIIENCIIRNNAGCGIGMAKGALRQAISGNLVHDNGNVGLLFAPVPISDPFLSSVSNNTIVGNSTNSLFRSNPRDLAFGPTAQSTTPCVDYANNLVGVEDVQKFDGRRLLMNETGNVTGCTLDGFTTYFKPKKDTTAGWPRANWPTVTSDWTLPTVPYCGDPATNAAYPLSLVRLRE